MFNGVYGNPDERSKHGSWELLRHLGHDQMFYWLVIRDFNEIMNSFEKKGRRLRSKRQMIEF